MNKINKYNYNLHTITTKERWSHIVEVDRLSRMHLLINLLYCYTMHWKQSYKIAAYAQIVRFYYSATALLAMQSAVLARGILSVCPSVRRLYFRHVPVLCPEEWRYDRVAFSLW